MPITFADRVATPWCVQLLLDELMARIRLLEAILTPEQLVALSDPGLDAVLTHEQEVTAPDAPLSPRAYVLAHLQERLEALEAENRALREQLAVSGERLARDSHNSSKPPSSDPPAARARRRTRPPSPRTRGGQPGHPFHPRHLAPPEACRSVIDCTPSACRHCGHELTGRDPNPLRHQVADIPKVVPERDEYRLHRLRCQACGRDTCGTLPEGVSPTGFGPGVEALVAVLTADLHASHRGVARVVADWFGLELGLGTVAKLCRRASRSVAPAVEQAHEAVRTCETAVHADESPWVEGNADGANPEGHRAYLWLAATEQLAVLEIALSRSQEAARTFLGETALGTIVTDRLGSYNFIPDTRRQVCWNHLDRDFVQMSERACVLSQVIGKGLHDHAAKLFGWWRSYQEGRLSAETFRAYTARLRRWVRALLESGASYQPRKGETSPRAETARQCRQILRSETSMWTFRHVAGVSPSNNHAERQLRPGVLWRKVSHGTQSAEGSLYVGRMLTVVQTLRLQKRPLSAFMLEACRAARLGTSPPSLLPAPT